MKVVIHHSNPVVDMVTLDQREQGTALAASGQAYIALGERTCKKPHICMQGNTDKESSERYLEEEDDRMVALLTYVALEVVDNKEQLLPADGEEGGNNKPLVVARSTRVTGQIQVGNHPQGVAGRMWHLIGMPSPATLVLLGLKYGPPVYLGSKNC